MAHPGGRPSKYTPELIAKAEHYAENYEDYGDPIPSIAGLACVLGITRETVHTWIKEEEKRQFSDIIKGMLAEQERALLKNGLKGEFSPVITKLVLSKHNYHDKQDTTVSGPDGGPIENKWTVEIVDPAKRD